MERNMKSLNILKKVFKSLIFFIYLTILASLITGGISAGIITLIPDQANKPCYLGYYAHCSFTPISTFILFIIAILGIVLLIKLIRYIKRKYMKFFNIKSKLKVLIKK